MNLLSNRARCLSAACLVLPALGGAALDAQEQPPRMRVGVNLVNLEVMVSDARGDSVSGLKPENFRVRDDGREQRITHFAAEEAPAQVLLLVETSPAVYLIHKQHLAAAGALLEGLAADDGVALATYSASAHLVLNMTADKRALADSLGRLEYALGVADLNLFPSLVTSLDWLETVPGKRAILLLSTGLDTSGTAGWEQLLDRLRTSDAVIFSVALGGELRRTPEKRGGKKSGAATLPEGLPPGLSFEQADRALETLAAETGGRAFFPRDAREFPGIYRQIASLLRHQYSLGFPPPARDARFHRLEVEIVNDLGQPLVGKDGKPLDRVNARRGYTAPRAE